MPSRLTNMSANGTFATMRFDLATKLALCASVIYGLGPEGSDPKQAVEIAAKIVGLADSMAGKLKAEAA